MGKGSSSGSNTAIKQARVSGTGTEGGGEGRSDQPANTCEFQFSERLLLNNSNAKVGDTVALVQNAADQERLDVFIGSARVGEYSGQHLQKILMCMNEKYSYSGTVASVKALGTSVEVACTIRGRGYEQSATTF